MGYHRALDEVLPRTKIYDGSGGCGVGTERPFGLSVCSGPGATVGRPRHGGSVDQVCRSRRNTHPDLPQRSERPSWPHLGDALGRAVIQPNRCGDSAIRCVAPRQKWFRNCRGQAIPVGGVGRHSGAPGRNANIGHLCGSVLSGQRRRYQPQAGQGNSGLHRRGYSGR